MDKRPRQRQVPKAIQLLSGETKTGTQSPYSYILSLWISRSRWKIVPVYTVKQSLL